MEDRVMFVTTQTDAFGDFKFDRLVAYDLKNWVVKEDGKFEQKSVKSTFQKTVNIVEIQRVEV